MLDWLIGRGVQSDQVTEAALVHLPVYVYKYDFAGKSYSAMVEGASGKVFAISSRPRPRRPTSWWRRYPRCLSCASAPFPLSAACSAAAPGWGWGCWPAGRRGLVAIPIFALAALVSAKV